MRPYLIGIRSASRLADCEASTSTGSGRVAEGSKAAWLLLGTSVRNCLPFAARSAGVTSLSDVSSSYLRGGLAADFGSAGFAASPRCGGTRRDRVRVLVVMPHDGRRGGPRASSAAGDVRPRSKFHSAQVMLAPRSVRTPSTAN